MIRGKNANAAGDLSTILEPFLAAVTILPQRIVLSGVSVSATYPMIRGVWGAALHRIAFQHFEQVFRGKGAGKNLVPAYTIRPPFEEWSEGFELDFILYGQSAAASEPVLRRAWDTAGAMGLGTEREPFVVDEILAISPGGEFLPPTFSSSGFALSEIPWPWLNGPTPEESPCRIETVTPATIRRTVGPEGKTRKVLIEQPDLVDIVRALHGRIRQFLPPDRVEPWQELRERVLDAAAEVPTSNAHWIKANIERYSGSQKRMDARFGSAGGIDLPEGPGPLARLLAVLPWTHAGSSVTLGLGMFRIEPLDSDFD